MTVGEGGAEGKFDLGNAQIPIWFESQEERAGSYRLGFWLRTSAPIDMERLQRALQRLVQNHEALRLVIDRERPVQHVADHCAPRLRLIRLEGAETEAEGEAAFHAHLAALFAEPMPFGEGPLFRVDVVEAGGLHYLALCFHHIIIDTVALRMVQAFLLQAYLADGADAAALPRSSFRQVVAADAAYNASEQFRDDQAHWRDRFASLPEGLIGAAPGRDGDAPFSRSLGRMVAAPADFAEAAGRIDLTPSRALFGLLAVALARRFGKADLVCGMALHRRDSRSLQTVGMLAGVMPLRIAFEEWWSLDDCLSAFSERLDEDLRHHRLPLPALHRAIGLGGDRGSLFDVAMSYVPGQVEPALPAGVSTGLVPTRQASAISFHVTDDPASGGLAYRIDINPDHASLIDPVTIADLLDEAVTLFLSGGDAAFCDVPAVPVAERATLDAMELTAIDAEEARLEALFDRQAETAPDLVAVVDADGTEYSYADIRARSRRVASALTGAGVKAGDVVGVKIPRSAATIIAFLGILRAGAVYLPLDPDLPDDRLDFMRADAGARVVLEGLDGWSGAGPDCPDLSDTGAAAYLIYTSGTTGRPKGVLVPHRAVANLHAARAAGHCCTGAGDRVLAGISVGFDVSIEQLLVPLFTGATVVIAPDLRLIGSAGFWAMMRERGITHLNSVPSFLSAMLAVPPGPDLPLRVLMLGGEVLSPKLAVDLARALPQARLVNVYGPTETCIEATAHEVVVPEAAGQADIRLPIGRPLANYRATVRDAELAPVGCGVEGELLLGGACLATGYMNQPDLTARRFVTDPAGGGRLYRTGDRVRWRLDGTLEFLGRMDDQIKLRGHRIEPAEIAAVLQRQPDVQDAAVIGRALGAAGLRLEGYFTGPADPDTLRRALRGALPAYMVPEVLVRLDALPMTVNGKLDTAALLALGAEAAEAGCGLEPPEGAEEIMVAAQMAALIAEETGEDAPVIGRRDDFFALGGHSLMAVRLAARIEAETGVALPLRSIFADPTVAGIAASLRSVPEGETGGGLAPIGKADGSGPVPLSFAQERLWFLDRLDPASNGAYRIDGAMRLTGALDADALARAFGEVVDRHESLRTRFAEGEDGVPVLSVAPDARSSGFALERARADGADAAALEGMVNGFLDRPYDLARGPLFRALLIELGATDHVLAIGGHHAILDGWSVALLTGQVAGCYRAILAGQAERPGAPVLQFSDYAHWQRRTMTPEARRADLDWWRATLDGLPDAIALPTDRPRPARMDYRGRSIRRVLPAATVAALTGVAREGQATLFTALQTALSAYLARLGAGGDVVIGTVVAGRPRPELESMTGFFVNTVALRNRIDPERSFHDQLRHGREVTLAALDHQDMPFDTVVEALRPARSMGHAPIVQVMLVLQNVPQARAVFDLGGVQVDAFGDRQAAKGTQFDLAFECSETADGLEVLLTYATALFDDGTAAQLLDGFARFCAAAADAPATLICNLPVMSEETWQTVMRWQGEVEVDPAPRVPDLVAQAPGAALALTDAGGEWVDYRALDLRAGRIAAALGSAGVKAGDVVGLCLSRSTDLPAAMLAAWKLGAAFVPVAPADPPGRKGLVLAEARAVAVVCDARTSDGLDGVDLPRLATHDLPDVAGAIPAPVRGHLAYVIFTSGSTGRPKGVAVSHDALGRMVRAATRDRAMTAEDCLISGFETTFDVFVRDVAMTLASGARLVLAEPRDLLRPGHLAGLVAAHRATWLQLTPTVWRIVLSDGWRPGPHMRVEAGGEAMDAELAAALGEGGALVINAYGPTEATALTVMGRPAAADIAAGRMIPIGRPLPGTRAYVLDARLRPVPPGVAGELVLGGGQVADGYVGRAGQTAAAFVADPFLPGARAYRTGDLVRWLPDGRIEFLGRKDLQVKVRGMRIEPGEIEAALAALPGIAQAAVVLQKDGAGQARLVGYVTTEAGDGTDPVAAPVVLDLAPLDPETLRRDLARSLPEHMIPQAFVRLDRLPLTRSGKLDRKALPAVRAQVAQADYVPVQGAMERLVATEIAALLAAEGGNPPERIGRNDNFFALGGHSILAVQLAARLEAATRISVPLQMIFDSQDVAALATRLERLMDGEVPDPAADIDAARRDIALAEELAPARAGHPAPIDAAEAILLTGATGFVGRHLLRDLLLTTRARVICLVRGATQEEARRRVLADLAGLAGDALDDGHLSRVEVVLGELSKPDLGLGAADRRRIVDEVDVILNNGAEVHSVKPYAMLRASNTLSVLDLCRMMGEGRPKSLIFVSTFGVVGTPLDRLRDGFDTELRDPVSTSGYNLSKWAAERIVLAARAKGYRAVIVRPGLVIGDSRTGYYKTDDIGQSYATLLMDTGALPDAMAMLPFPWVNVDRASRLIIGLAREDVPGGIAHVIEHGAAPPSVVVAALRQSGIDAEVIGLRAWLERATGLLRTNPGHPSAWLLPGLAQLLRDLGDGPGPVFPPEDAAALLAHFAPPAVPGAARIGDRPSVEEGLTRPILWLADRRKTG